MSPEMQSGAPSYTTSPASVFPLDREARWSVHQYVGGELCLEWGPDNWHQDVTGANLLQSLARLLRAEEDEAQGAPPAPSRHRLSVGQALRTSSGRFVLDWSSQEVLGGLPPGTSAPATFRMRFIPDPTTSLVYLAKMGPVDDGEQWTNGAVPESVLAEGYAIQGFVLTAERLPPVGEPLEAADLRQALETRDLSPDAVDRGEPLGLLWVDPAGECVFGARIGGASDPMRLERTIVVAKPDRSMRLAPEFAALDRRSVAVVGLGSVGSKIAESLARAGVGMFLLVDDDLVLPDNLLRHARDWRDVGLHKAHAVSQAIRRINPSASVEVRRTRLDAQESSATAAALDQRLADCDLIIDASASPASFNRAANISVRSQTSLLWMAVYSGGIGGFFARSRPGRDPDPLTMRAQMDAWASEQGVEAPESTLDYGMEGADGAVHVASDAAVGAIAAHATAMALDSLIRREPSAYEANVYLLGLARDWVFKRPLHVFPLALEPTPQPEKTPSPQGLEKMKAVILDLLGSSSDDSSATT